MPQLYEDKLNVFQHDKQAMAHLQWGDNTAEQTAA